MPTTIMYVIVICNLWIGNVTKSKNNNSLEEKPQQREDLECSVEYFLSLKTFHKSLLSKRKEGGYIAELGQSYCMSNLIPWLVPQTSIFSSCHSVSMVFLASECLTYLIHPMVIQLLNQRLYLATREALERASGSRGTKQSSLQVVCSRQVAAESTA